MTEKKIGKCFLISRTNYSAHKKTSVRTNLLVQETHFPGQNFPTRRKGKTDNATPRSTAFEVIHVSVSINYTV